MIYLLYGADTYRSRQKLRELSRAFESKSGGLLGVTRVDVEDSPGRVSELNRSGSLFSTRQLFIIENVSRAPPTMADRILELARAWARDRETFVIFWEGEPGEKEPLLLTEVKTLAAKSQEFKLLPSAKVSPWLDAEAKKRTLALSAAAKRLLVDSFGSDLWALSNELDKIQSGATVRERRHEEEKIWNFTDAFFSNRRTAIAALGKLLGAGLGATYLLGALSSALRTLALISWGLASGKLSRATDHLHPYVVKKSAEIAKRLDGKHLRNYYAALLNADLELKTGKFPSPLPLLRLLLKQKQPR